MLHMLGLPDILGNPGTGTGIFDVMGKFVACLYLCSRCLRTIIVLIHDYPVLIRNDVGTRWLTALSRFSFCLVSYTTRLGTARH